MVTKETFKKYEKIRASGVTNMMDVKTICLLAGISREECFDIMKNYSKYKETYDINAEMDRDLANEYEMTCEECGELESDCRCEEDEMRINTMHQ